MLGDSPWGVRDSIPLTPPQTIRALDSVQRLFAAGPALGRFGRYPCPPRDFVCRGAQRPGSRHVAFGAPDPGAPRHRRDRRGCRRSPQFGAPVGPGHRCRASSPTAGCGRDIPRWRSIASTPARRSRRARTSPTSTGWPASTAGPRCCCASTSGGGCSGQPPLGPVLLTADARGAGLPVPAGVTVTDTPVARETDYGRVDDHSSAIRAAGDARHTFNRVPDYPVPGADTVYGAWTGGRLTASSSSSDSTALPDVAPATSPAAAIDGDSATAWVSNALQSAVGQWLQSRLRPPGDQRRHHHDAQRDRRRRPGPPHRDRNRHRHNHSAVRRARQAAHRGAALRRDPVGADHRDRHRRRSAGVQFGITDLSITQYDASGFAHPVDLRHTVLVPGPPPDAAVARVGPGIGTAGQAGLRPGARRRAVRAVDGAGAGGAGQLQPHAERADARCR